MRPCKDNFQSSAPSADRPSLFASYSIQVINEPMLGDNICDFDTLGASRSLPSLFREPVI